MALGLVYYMRLDTEYRRKFVDELDKMHFEVNFLSAFTQEVICNRINNYEVQIDFGGARNKPELLEFI